jgi:uncharacterized protein YjiS (DUF1127 family)
MVPPMLLMLRGNECLRLRRGAGTWIEVISGCVWLTEGAHDRLLGPGRRYRVRGDALVLVGSEARGGEAPCAEIAVAPRADRGLARAAREWLFRRVAIARGALSASFGARRTRLELEGLSDHLLRDIGLRREQIEAASRAPRPL